MKNIYNPKDHYEISAINELIREDIHGFIAMCEERYAQRMEAVVDEIEARGATIVLVTGPSASGKTTSSNKLAKAFERRGRRAYVISLDDFFKNIANYPKTPDGKPDMESVYALDVDEIHKCLGEILEKGESDLPLFDFVTQSRKPQRHTVKVQPGDVLIIEGIHAHNPLLTETVDAARLFRLYVSIRAEYCVDGTRTIATRDIRIMRRSIRDFYFRGYSVEMTLDNWTLLRAGEDKWIRPFKELADAVLDSSFLYEPGVMAPLMQKICCAPDCGGAHRETLLALRDMVAPFDAVSVEDIPKSCMIREFYGGLEL